MQTLRLGRGDGADRRVSLETPGEWRFERLVKKRLAEIIRLFTGVETIRSEYAYQHIAQTNAAGLIAAGPEKPTDVQSYRRGFRKRQSSRFG